MLYTRPIKLRQNINMHGLLETAGYINTAYAVPWWAESNYYKTQVPILSGCRQQQNDDNDDDESPVKLGIQHISQTGSHLSAVDVVDDEVEFVGSLERVVKTDEKWMVHIADEHVSLSHDVCRLIGFEHVRLAEHLHCVQLLVSLVTRQ